MDPSLMERIKDAERLKKQASALCRFLKTSKAAKFMNTAHAMCGDSINTFSYVGQYSLNVYLSVSQLEGFKDKRLAGILETWDYMNPSETKTEDNPVLFERNTRMVWRFPETSEVDIIVNVCVSAQIKSDSETCKRVVSGVRPEASADSRLIYKFVCDEDKPTEFPVNQIADVSADLDELTRAKSVADPTEPVPAADLGKWGTQ